MGKGIKKGISFLVISAMILGLFGTMTKSQSMAASADGRKIDVWDIGGVAEEDTNLYNNNIKASDWDSQDTVSDTGYFTGGTTVFGDLTIYHNANDRLYVPDSVKNCQSGSTSATTATYDDGYQANGIYYCNGTGGINRRNLVLANVVAGDKICVYMTSSNSGSDNVHFLYMGEDETNVQDDIVIFDGSYTKLDFVAKYSGTYKIYAEATAAKPTYSRIVRMPGVYVTGNIDLNGNDVADYGLKFRNNTTGEETVATLNNNTYAVTLAPTYSYTAVLTGAIGYSFTDDSKIITPTLDEVLTDKTDVTLVVNNVNLYTAKGSIKGFLENYDKSNLNITLKVAEESLSEDVALKINEDLTFEALLESGIEYTAELSGANDYDITQGAIFNSETDLSQDITVTAKPTYITSGNFVGLPSESVVSDITFTNVDDDYTYSGEVQNNNSYKVSLRDGAYTVNATVEGYTTKTHIVVSGENVTRDLKFVATDETTETIPLVSDIYVGYKDGSTPNYDTVTDAIKACKAMNPTSEEQRITVHIAPGVYRAQLIINTPYITLVNDNPSEEVKLTWYYGIGYKYYSSDETGYYNENNAFDKYDKNIASRWGCSTYVQNGATAFRAENITFEASFNKYVTEEEIADGVELSMGESIRFERTLGADVTSKTATERSCALAIEADKTEFLNCSFLGSQDTLYTNPGIRNYFKNCVIEGSTDYIFGDGDVVFDDCELRWAGYSEGATGGYITAAKDTATYGYLFKNCKVTANPNLTVATGSFGRPWSAGAKVTYLNTVLERADLISGAGWNEMSGNKPENANYKEYNTTTADGQKVDTSGRIAGTVIDEAEASAIDEKNYFGDWNPVYYEETPVDVSISSAKGQILSDTTTASDKTDMRVTASINCLDAKKVGFVISLSNEEPTVDGANCKDIFTKTVYTSIKAGGQTILPTDIADDGKYIFTARLTNIPNNKFDSKIYVRSYTIKADDTIVYQTTQTFTINQFLQ